MQELDAAVRQLISRVISRYTRRSSLVGPRINLVGTTKKRTHTRGRAKCPASFSLAGQVVQAWLRLAKPASGQQGGVIQSGAGNRTPKRCREKRCPVFKSFALGQGIEKGLPPLAKGSPDFALLQFSGKKSKKACLGRNSRILSLHQKQEKNLPGGMIGLWLDCCLC